MKKIQSVPPRKTTTVLLDKKTNARELVRFQRKITKTRTLCLKEIISHSARYDGGDLQPVNYRPVWKMLSKCKNINNLAVDVEFTAFYQAKISQLMNSGHTLLKVNLIDRGRRCDMPRLLSSIKKCRGLRTVKTTGGDTSYDYSHNILNITSKMHNLRHLSMDIENDGTGGWIPLLNPINRKFPNLQSLQIPVPINYEHLTQQSLESLEKWIQNGTGLKDVKLKIEHYLDYSSYRVHSKIQESSAEMCIRSLEKLKQSSQFPLSSSSIINACESLTNITIKVCEGMLFSEQLIDALKRSSNLKSAQLEFTVLNKTAARILEVFSQKYFSLKELQIKLDSPKIGCHCLKNHIPLLIFEVLAAHPLEILDLRVTNLSKESFLAIPYTKIFKSLGSHASIKTLKLITSSLAPYHKESLPDMSLLKQLEKVKLWVEVEFPLSPEDSKYIITEKDITRLKCLSKLLQEIPNLKSLKYGLGDINLQILKIIERQILRSPKLTDCKLSFISVRDFTVELIQNSVKQLSELECLEFLSVDLENQDSSNYDGDGMFEVNKRPEKLKRKWHQSRYLF